MHAYLNRYAGSFHQHGPINRLVLLGLIVTKSYHFNSLVHNIMQSAFCKVGHVLI